MEVGPRDCLANYEGLTFADYALQALNLFHCSSYHKMVLVQKSVCSWPFSTGTLVSSRAQFCSAGCYRGEPVDINVISFSQAGCAFCHPPAVSKL